MEFHDHHIHGHRAKNTVEAPKMNREQALKELDKRVFQLKNSTADENTIAKLFDEVVLRAIPDFYDLPEKQQAYFLFYASHAYEKHGDMDKAYDDVTKRKIGIRQ